MLLKECLCGFRLHGMDRLTVIDGHTDALAAVAAAESAGEADLARKIVGRHQLLEFLDDIPGTLEMTGRTDTDCYFLTVISSLWKYLR